MTASGQYFVCTARVMFDTQLTDFDKLLFSQITSLTTEHGYCWATDIYFAKKNNKGTRTISRAIASLKKHGYISVSVVASTEGGSIRYIRITPLGYRAHTKSQSIPDSPKKATTYSPKKAI